MEEIPLSALIIIQLAVIALNAYLSVLDSSIESLNDGKVKRLAEDGDRSAIKMLSIENIDVKLSVAIKLSAILLNTLSGAFVVTPLVKILSTMFLFNGNGLAIEHFTLYKLLMIFAILLVIVFFTVVFGSIIPQRIFMSKSTDKAVRKMQNAAKVLYLFFRPTVYAVLAISDRFTKKCGISAPIETSESAEDEILMIIDEGEEKGTIQSNEKEMIENVFNFSTTAASAVMTHRTNVFAIWIDDTKEEILRIISQTGKSRFPVYGDDIDQILGILIARDFLLNICSDSPKPISELLRPAYLVPETIHTNDLLKDMQLNNTHMAIVVDEYGGTSGIVTMEDLLEELVGNIYDELDSPADQTEIKKLEENLWLVPGDVDLETLSTELMITFPDDKDYDTVGGLIFSCLSSIPPDGAHPEIITNGIYIYVEELKNRRIISAKVSLIMGVEQLDEAISDEE